MKILAITLAICSTLIFSARSSEGARFTPLIVDHNHTDIWRIPVASIVLAKETLHIAYGHTSHGSCRFSSDNPLKISKNTTCILSKKNGQKDFSFRPFCL